MGELQTNVFLLALTFVTRPAEEPVLAEALLPGGGGGLDVIALSVPPAVLVLLALVLVLKHKNVPKCRDSFGKLNQPVFTYYVPLCWS